MSKKIILSLMLIISFAYVIASSLNYLTIDGSKHSYKIPTKYLKTSSSILYPGNLTGDKAKIISLLIPMHEFSSLVDDKDEVASVLIYLDRKRSANKSFEKLSKQILNKEVLLDHMPPYYHFTEKTGDSIDDIYLSFNPKNILDDLSEDDFIVTMTRSETFQIGKKITKTTPRCSFKIYKDGIGMTFSFPNEICKVSNFKKLKELQEVFFERHNSNKFE